MARQQILQMGIVMVLMGGSLSASASSVSISIGDKGVRFTVSDDDYHSFLQHRQRIQRRPDLRHRIPIFSDYSGYPPIPSHRKMMIRYPHKSHKVIVWINNCNGSKTRIVLTRTPYGYKGPRGEYYDHLPSKRQLRRAYGL